MFIAGESTLRFAVALVMSLIPRDVSNEVLDAVFVVVVVGVGAVVVLDDEGKYIELRRKASSENSSTGRNWVSA